MSSGYVPILKPVFWAFVLTLCSGELASAATNNCAALAALPGVLEVDQGLQQDIDRKSVV